MAKKKSGTTVVSAPDNGNQKLDQIRRRAYELYEQDGCEHGRDLEHWVRAEAEISLAISKNSSKSATTGKK